MIDKEIRSMGRIELRSSDDESRKICGYAVRFDEWSSDLGFYEKIARGAISQDVIDSSDIFMTYDHQDSNFLARSKNGKGTLELRLDDEGLYFEFECPDTSFGNDVLSKIRRGELTECSFAFSLSQDPEVQKWEKRSDGKYERTIYKIERLYDCAICPNGAYKTTSVSCRSFDEIQAVTEALDAQLREVIELYTDSL